MMGARGYEHDEEPVHEVEITQDFYLGIYPVTQAQFRAWTQAQSIKPVSYTHLTLPTKA